MIGLAKSFSLTLFLSRSETWQDLRIKTTLQVHKITKIDRAHLGEEVGITYGWTAPQTI